MRDRRPTGRSSSTNTAQRALDRLEAYVEGWQRTRAQTSEQETFLEGFRR